MCRIAYIWDLTTNRNVALDAVKMAEALYNRGQHGTGLTIAMKGFPRILESGKKAIEHIALA